MVDFLETSMDSWNFKTSKEAMSVQSSSLVW